MLLKVAWEQSGISGCLSNWKHLCNLLSYFIFLMENAVTIAELLKGSSWKARFSPSSAKPPTPLHPSLSGALADPPEQCEMECRGLLVLVGMGNFLLHISLSYLMAQAYIFTDWGSGEWVQMVFSHFKLKVWDSCEGGNRIAGESLNNHLLPLISDGWNIDCRQGHRSNHGWIHFCWFHFVPCIYENAVR